jgi:site-specific recombinase XerD|tara:strand:+ start:731 stop:1888 length:1158 start_codon:yes stop_codon:yes gene_type:complete
MRQRKKTFTDQKRLMIIGRFHDYILPSGTPVTRDLITVEMLAYQHEGSRRRKRGEVEQEKMLRHLYNQELHRLESEGIKRRAGKLMAKDAVQQWLDEKSVRLEKITIRGYADSLSYLIKAVGDFELAYPPVGIPTKLIKHLQIRGMNDASINSRVQACQIFLNWCDALAYTPKRIKLEKMRVSKEAPEILTENDYINLLALLDDTIGKAKGRTRTSALNMKRATVLMRYTGMRGGEARALPMSHIDLLAQEIKIADVPEAGFKVKGRVESVVPIAKDYLIRFLEDDRQSRNVNEKWFLDDGFGGLQWAGMTPMGKVFRRTFRQIGISDKVSPTHGFRATVISNLLNKGASPVCVQYLARHKHISTTMGYHKADSSEIRKQIEAHL